MKRWSRSVGLVVLGLLVLFALGQLVRPARTNPQSDPAQEISARLPVSHEVAAIFDRSCKDCHSNKTRWPWYTNISPISWILVNHVNEGRDHLNLSEWGLYNRREAQDILSQICKEVKSGGMPLSSYTRIHKDARLSTQDVAVLCSWTNTQLDLLDATPQ